MFIIYHHIPLIWSFSMGQKIKPKTSRDPGDLHPPGIPLPALSPSPSCHPSLTVEIPLHQHLSRSREDLLHKKVKLPSCPTPGAPSWVSKDA